MAYRNFKDKDKPKDITFENGRRDEGAGVTTNYGLEIKSMKNLHASSVSVQADPYTAALPAALNYPLQARTNVMISPSYGGEANIDGGNVQQYVNGVSSQLLKNVDYLYTRFFMNYAFAPVKAEFIQNGHYPGKEILDTQRRTVAEAESVLKSTSFTTLAINSYAIETDMAAGSAVTTNIATAGGSVPVYKETADVLFLSYRFYQLVWQTIYSMIVWFNAFRLKQGLMIRAGFDREVPQLNSLFGYFNKKSLIDGPVSSVCSAFPGEYFDSGFARSIATIMANGSRQSNDLFNPHLEAGLLMVAPTKFKIHVLNDSGTTSLATIDLMDVLSCANEFHEPTVRKSLWVHQQEFIDWMAAQSIAQWARSTSPTSESVSSYFNKCKGVFDALNVITTAFKPAVADIRESMDVLARAGIIQWSKGFTPVIVDTRKDQGLFRNILIEDLFRSAFSSCNQISFDNNTKRWRYFTLWNMYTGVPEYDVRNGGAFLSLSFKNISRTADDDATTDYAPVAFYGQDGVVDGQYTLKVWCTSRSGDEVVIERETVNFKDHIALRRLTPLLSQSNFTVRVPKVVTSDPKLASEMYRVMTKMFGISHVVLMASTAADAEIVEDDLSCDPDLLAVYQIEIEDITNEARTYARATSPIASGGSTRDRIFGFAALAPSGGKGDKSE